ncbi:MAG: GTPase [candidate division Zixibacteria bacterium]|nr:GTPase [candidate division Zixibacteria bacterium]
MPANLPPQYYELEREFRAEKDVREKLRMAKELLRIMPKHKGTDKLQAEMKAKISKLNRQIDSGSRGGGTRQVTAMDHIDKEGAGQVIIIGPPNCGKSSLLDALTGAKPLVANYSYTTREPMAGMMTFETVQIQLIDTPPISTDLYENYLSGLIRNADMVVLVCGLANESMITGLEFIFHKLEEKRIVLKPDTSEKSENLRQSIKKTILCAHKTYEDESGEKRARLRERFPGFPIVGTSIIDDDSLDAFKKAVYDGLKIIRVYTKPVGKEADFTDPIILPFDSTVEDAAVTLHKDFAAKLRFAKIWGEGKFDGQRVQRDFKVRDGDIIEFHV